MKYTLILAFLILIPVCLHAQSYRFSGTILDSLSGEALPNATITLSSSRMAIKANAYGYFSIPIEKDRERITITHIGYTPLTLTIFPEQDTHRNLYLVPAELELEEVVISSQTNESLKDFLPGKNSLQVSQVKKMPTLGGEADIFHALQYLPGIRAAVEGTTGLSVRGGSFDQTLVTLDEASVYNTAHALGFFSSFNPDAVKGIDIYKGLIPAQFGGRLSSVVDIRMREGNNQDFKVSGGIGLIASRLTVEGPFKKDRASFFLSGRYSYAGQTANLAGSAARFLNFRGFQNFEANNKISFYDVNGKVNWKGKNNKDHFFVSAYSGRDWFSYLLFQKGTYTKWQNTTASLRWNRVYSPRLFANTTLYHSSYYYDYTQLYERRDFMWKAGLKETGIKHEMDYYRNAAMTFKVGINGTRSEYQPGSISQKTSESLTLPFELERKQTAQAAAFAGTDVQLSPKLSGYFGLRYAAFALLGPGTSYLYQDRSSVPIDSVRYEKGKSIHTMSGLEPRISVTYRPDSSKVVGIAFSKTQQFLHLLSNSSVGLPTDVWLPANKLISPQQGYQSSVSYKQNFPEFSLSVEAYGKQSDGVIDFVDNADLFLNQYIETQVRTGKETAYGVETLLEKKTGKLTGWLTYTLAKTQRKIEDINNGNPYPTRYDRRHSLSLVSSYSINRNFYASLDFQYNSGGAISLPGAVYQYQNATFNYYESKNAIRLPAFHRMDVQVGYQRTRKWGREQFVVGLYNLYNRLNIFSIEVLPAAYANLQYSTVEATSLYGIVPFIGYNFNF